MAEDKGVGLKGWLTGPRSKDARAEQGRRLSSPLDAKRIAVLPFTSMSPDPNDSYFADGVTEEVISRLSNISGLTVISRTSVMGYKGTTKKVREIGQELEAGSVLEGSLRKAGNRIRVTAQLITVSGDAHVWGQSYDRQLDDVFAVQTDIAKQVAEALRVRILTPEMSRLERKPTVNMKAYTSYLKGRQQWNTRTVEGIEKAIEFFDEAVREDRNFALGYVGLADCHEILVTNWWINTSNNRERARMFLAKALELEPDLAEAHATRGLILLYDFKLEEVEQELRTAIEQKPSYASAHLWLYKVLAAGGTRTNEAFTEIEKAVELDPASGIINTNLAECYRINRDYHNAMEIGKRSVGLDPGLAESHYFLAMDFARLNMLGDAEREMDIMVKLVRHSQPDAEKTAKITIDWLKGDKHSVGRLLPELEGNAGGPWPTLAAWEVAGFYFWFGETEKGFVWIERSFSMKEETWLALYDDRFDNVRESSRFVNLFRKMKLEPQQRV